MRESRLVVDISIFHTVVGAQSDKVKSCTFDTDTCDWQNVPFDDEMDFVIRSSTVSGSTSQAGGTG